MDDGENQSLVSPGPDFLTVQPGERASPHRRKVRRGTSSCWECKRRKTRCDFEPASRTVCTSCRRRGTRCVPQFLTEEGTDPGYRDVGHRIDRLESLVEGLIRRGGLPHSHPVQRQLRPRYDVTRDQRHLSSRPASSSGISLSSLVYSFLPTATSASLIMRHGTFLTMSLGRAREPLEPLIEADASLRGFDPLPPPSSHPIVLAAKLIQLAICLRHMNPQADVSALKLGSCSVRDVADHYFLAAAQHVTTNDALVSSMEGLDALMLEGIYHLNVGNMHHGRVVFRRAVAIAKRIGLHRISGDDGGGSSAHRRASVLWASLVCSERYLSLMLNLPVLEVPEASFASKELIEEAPPNRKLDRLHGVIAGRLAARNGRMKSCSTSLPGADEFYEETRGIDDDLKKVARMVPTRWWLQPTVSSSPGTTEESVIAETSKCVSQIDQYYLVLNTHLPYITTQPTVSGSSTEDGGGTNVTRRDYTYNKVTAATAAHSLLSRFLANQNSKHALICSRGHEAKGVTAAMTLLIAHISDKSSPSVLEHRRPGDLDMVERMIKRLEQLGRETRDVMNAECARVMRRLVEVEEEAAGGDVGYSCAWEYGGCASEGVVGRGVVLEDGEGGVLVRIPYFGEVTLTRLWDVRPSTGALRQDVGEMMLHEKGPSQGRPGESTVGIESVLMF